MYLTRFPVNRTRRLTPQMLASPDRLHAAVMGSFPPDAPGQDNPRVLWRVDIEPSGATWLYIVSPTPPSLVGLDEQIGFNDQSLSWLTRDYDSFLGRLAEGQVWSFRLTANPVRTVARDIADGRTNVVGKRIAHITAAQQASWLIGRCADERAVPAFNQSVASPDSRACRNGFDVMANEAGCPHLAVSNRHMYNIRRRDGAKPIKLVTAQFDGVLQVSDADRLRHALTQGIGHGKAFGCGLITLAALSEP